MAMLHAEQTPECDTCTVEGDGGEILRLATPLTFTKTVLALCGTGELRQPGRSRVRRPVLALGCYWIIWDTHQRISDGCRCAVTAAHWECTRTHTHTHALLGKNNIGARTPNYPLPFEFMINIHIAWVITRFLKHVTQTLRIRRYFLLLLLMWCFLGCDKMMTKKKNHKP